MKKEILLMVIVLMVLPMVIAVDMKLSSKTYSPGETMQVKITGNFIGFNIENILIYEEGIPRSAPVISDLIKQNKIFYYYAVLPNSEGNYSLRIEDSTYTELGLLKSDSIVKNFTIKLINGSSLQINPGFIVVNEGEEFIVKVKSLSGDQIILTELKGETEAVTLVDDFEEELKFTLGRQNLSQINLEIGSYSIPIFVINKVISEDDEVGDDSDGDNVTVEDVIDDEGNGEVVLVDIENFTEDEIEVLSCSSIGVVCPKNYKCLEVEVKSLNGPCCLGQCEEIKKSKWKLYLGIAIILTILGVLEFIYLKAKKKLKPRSTDEILENKSRDFESRMDGGEVSGGIGRV